MVTIGESVGEGKNWEDGNNICSVYFKYKGNKWNDS